MPSLASSSLRLLRRVLGAPVREPGDQAGAPVIRDGNTAVAQTETGICNGAGLGGSFPADGADIAWRTEQARLRTNAQGAVLISRGADNARGALAATLGLALAGDRATCFLSSLDLEACRDLLRTAVARRLPLVLHLAGRSPGGPGAALGNGQEAMHAAAGTGALVLAAATVQEAVDLTLIGRRVAEQLLLPVVVVMDGPQTALALQDVRLPPARLLRDLLGAPDDLIPVALEVQRHLFGDHRRRVPRWHDADHPVLLDALHPADAAGAARAAARAYLDADPSPFFDEAAQRLRALTGRSHHAVTTHRVDDARVVLVAIGSMIETAETVADRARASHRAKVGVVGIRRLSPFPAAELVGLLAGKSCICVLECVDTPLTEDPPLLLHLRAALGRAGESRGGGDAANGDYPRLSGKDRPRLLSVIYGLGGLPVRGADLIRLCREAPKLSGPRVYLGVDFAPETSAYPKREVLLDRLRRAHPEIAGLGMRGRDTDAKGAGAAAALTLAIQRRTGDGHAALITEAAALLHGLQGGGVRGRPGLFVQPWGQTCVDRLNSAPGPLADPGDDCPVDLLLLLTDRSLVGGRLPVELDADARVLALTRLPEETLWARLPAGERQRLKEGGALYLLPPPDGEPGLQSDYLLGAICALLLETGLIDTTRRRLLALREDQLKRAVADADARLKHFEAGLGAPRRIDVTRLPRATAGAGVSTVDQAPALVHHIGGRADAYDSLPRFWDQVGVLYSNGDTDELGPDPHLGLGAIPQLAAGFRDHLLLRERLPVLDPSLCTGCGRCWSACPEGAIGALALTPARLIDAGIRAAGADVLRPIAGKLADAAVKRCLDATGGPDTRPTNAGLLLREAFAQLEDRLPFPDERKQAIGKAVDACVDAIGAVPVVASEALFQGPERDRQGGGLLLALSLSPHSCKACGLCVASCEPGALRTERQGSQALAAARAARAAWHRLPDSEADVAQRAAQSAEPDALALALLGQGAARSTAGGDGVEPGSGARLALRLTVAMLEAHQARLQSAHADAVEQARGRILALIRDVLAGALPADDLDRLAVRLQAIDSRQADLGAILGPAREAVDTARLRRLVDLAQQLGALVQRLRQGDHGQGRARFGLVLSPGAAVGWAGAFPDNAFAQPTVLDWTGDGAQLAAGLLEGQLRQATHGLALLRKAHLELERPADAARLWADLDSLSWRDLSPDERALCPPLLLVGDSGSLGRRGLAPLIQLLGAELPLRVLLLADLDLGLATDADLDLPVAAVEDAEIDLGLLALSRREAYLAQTSIGSPDHLAASLHGAFAHPGPALLHLFAPSPQRHGFATDRTLERARMAVAARVLPLFRYDPSAPGVLGSRLDLDGNPAPLEPLQRAPDGSALTPAHWALGERRFAHLFSPLAEDAPGPTPLADYLDLPNAERRGRTPFVERAANGSDAQRLVIDASLLRVCEQRLQAWRVLQELAGVVTPFTERVRAEAEAEVAATHEAELAELRAEHEARLAALRADYEQELRRQIQERLLRLAGYGPKVPRRASDVPAGEVSRDG